MKKFFLFMVIFGLAFAGIQKVEAEEVAVTAIEASDVKTLNIPCVKAQGISYKVTLKEYLPSDAEKKEVNLNSQEVSFWELANADILPQPPAACGIWDEKTFNFNSCEGDFKFRRDMEGKDVFGFYWVKEPIPTTSIGNLDVSQPTVDTKQGVTVYFVNPNIKSALYEATGINSGSFTEGKDGYFYAILDFPTVGAKTITVSGNDFCGATAIGSTVEVTVKDPCADSTSPSIPFLHVSPKTVRLNENVKISFSGNPNIQSSSYTTSDGQKGNFIKPDPDKIPDKFTVDDIKFATPGKKTITVNVVNSCQKTASQSFDVLVCGDNIGFSIVDNQVKFGDGKIPSTGYDPAPKDSDLVIFDINRTIIVRESATNHLVSFAYKVDPSSLETTIRIFDYFHEIPNKTDPLYEFKTQTDGEYSSIIIPHDGLFDLLIEATDQCGTYQKVFSVQFQRP